MHNCVVTFDVNVLSRFEKLLAAEALRRNENDTQTALDDLTNPEKNATLQVLRKYTINQAFTQPNCTCHSHLLPVRIVHMMPT